ncbi:MAG: hypothetical protein R3F30_14310 [Planctomycetota bacterium]
MVSLSALLLPILLASVAVFLVSSVLHMLLPIHKGDFKKLPDEEGARAALRDVPPGEYMLPCPSSMKDMASPEVCEKFKQGPVGFLILRPAGMPNMGKGLLQWFLYSVLLSFFVAYIATMGLPEDADYDLVFRFTGTTAILGYSLAYIPDSIWKGLSWSTTLKFFVDGVIYGLFTGGVFGWLWPRG